MAVEVILSISNSEKTFLKVPFYSPIVHKSKFYFDNSFSYNAPKIWNNLPLDSSNYNDRFFHVSKDDLKLICLLGHDPYPEYMTSDLIYV